MLKVMIVDDMDIGRRELKRLKLWGEEIGFFIAEEAKNGQEALKKLEENPIDLIITDIKMPKVDGIELLKIVSDKKLCSCVVLLSDYSEFNYARQGLVLGAFDYMVKPVNEEDLNRVLQRVKKFILDKRHEQQSITQLKQRLAEKMETFFPQAEVNQIVELMEAGDEKAVEYADHIVDIVYLNLNQDLIKTISMLNNIMYEIVNKLLKTYEWLEKFIDIRQIEIIDFLRFKDINSIKDVFISAVEKIIKLQKILQYGTQEKDIINQICRYILENIDEEHSMKGELSLKAVADALYINKSYISEAFKQKTGMSFTEYLTIVKMERAKKLIADGRLKTYEIAGQLGFKDIEYFSRLFKKYIGFSPTEYRKNILEKN